MTQDKAEDIADAMVRAVADLVEKMIDMKTGKASYYSHDQNEREALRDAVLASMGMKPAKPRVSRD